MDSLIAEISSVYIQENLPVSRISPRPPALKQSDYDERYDFKMLFADIFRCNDRIILSGPPLFNLNQLMQTAKFYVDSELYYGTPHLQDIDRTQNSYLTYKGKPSTLSIDCGWISAKKEIQNNHSDFFRDSKVLFTMSKDNDLQWICDWCEFYIKIHGIDAVLIYNNNTTIYKTEDIIDRLTSVAGLKKAAVVNFPIKYGALSYNKSKWDSDFAVYIQLQHARLRFLSLASGVINADIDELIVSDDDKTVFDHLRHAQNGYITYKGIWVEPILKQELISVPRHRDFLYISKDNLQECIWKWAADFKKITPETQARVHDFFPRDPASFIDKLHIRHFKGISSGWKRNTSPILFNPEIHEEDIFLHAAFKKIGWI